jgi:hypothetical protein
MSAAVLTLRQCDLAREFADRAQDLVTRVRNIDVRVAEDARNGELRREMSARLEMLAGEAAALLTSAMDAFDGDGDEDPCAERNDARPVSDVAALARITLREKQQLLQRVDAACDAWEIVDRCDRAQRAIARAMVALDHALADVCGFPPGIEIVDECARGLRVRTAYAKFRSAVLGIEQRHGTATARIRAAATAMAILTGRDEYELMRVSDRRQLRTLQERAHAWLSSRDGAPQEGEHLWQELLTVTSLLLQINARAELIAHDQAALRELTALPCESSDSVWRRLLTLRGLDVALDRVLDNPRDFTTADWRADVERLAADRAAGLAGTALESQTAAQFRG